LIPRRAYTVPLPSGQSLVLGQRTCVMGVLNVTPDSFSDGGRFLDPSIAADAALEMAEAGADVIDIGGESTRPGSEAVSEAEERARILPVVRAVARQVRIPLSIDTYKADVARAAIDEGVTIINDISGLQYEPAVAGVAAASRAALVLMHTRGRPADMYERAHYGDVVREVAQELAGSIRIAQEAGVSREALIIDPGLGFAKHTAESLDVLARLDHAPLLALGLPMLVGPSRKSFLTSGIGKLPPVERDWATAAAVAVAIVLGAHIVRVHRVREIVQVARVTDLLCEHRFGP
jgi:dihydropteroate synthase